MVRVENYENYFGLLIFDPRLKGGDERLSEIVVAIEDECKPRVAFATIFGEIECMSGLPDVLLVGCALLEQLKILIDVRCFLWMNGHPLGNLFNLFLELGLRPNLGLPEKRVWKVVTTSCQHFGLNIRHSRFWAEY